MSNISGDLDRYLLCSYVLFSSHHINALQASKPWNKHRIIQREIYHLLLPPSVGDEQILYYINIIYEWTKKIS